MATVAAPQPFMQQPYSTAQINARTTRELGHGSNHAQVFNDRIDPVRTGQGEHALSSILSPSKSVIKAQQTSESLDTDQSPTQQDPPLVEKRLVTVSTESSPRRRQTRIPNAAEDSKWEVRHGFEDQYSSHQYLEHLHSRFYMYFTDKHHETGGKPKNEDHSRPEEEWRMRDRLKTVSAALAICLNIGVDPPDVVKTNPTAELECWTNITSLTTQNTKIMELIGKKLQEQYESLSIRTRYKQYLDPSVDETKKFCVSLRRNAKDERVLFHYNGHGVPLPTNSGEIWVFNRNYTQYIPVSLYDLQLWLAGPSLYVLDVSHAGNVILNFERFVEKHEIENVEAREKDSDAPVQFYGDNILLAACGKVESLPTNPDLPADLFTSCLTTPIDISLRFFVLENQLPSDLTIKDLARVPGRLQERRSPLGELNWIFTAITDTIAWNLLPRALFKKLFRQDLMVAALFRNFLLSERIMRSSGCHPMSLPALPDTHMHPLWEAWDLSIEMVLTQLPAMIASEDDGPSYVYQHSDFFSDQLTAFEVYLSQGAADRKAPDQLPIVLQVLLSQVHRLRALILLGKFLDLGPWAVNLALSIGIFPYVLKLLQSAAFELKPVMIFIWARILAVDKSCQTDLLKDNGYQYFLTMLQPQSVLLVSNASEHRAMCAFIIATFCRDYHQGQMVCQSPELVEACLDHLCDVENSLLRQWSCLCLSMLWVDFPEAKWVGIRCLAHRRLCEIALDPVPEVRAAALHALTNFIGIPDLTEQVAHTEESIASAVLIMTADGNTMVRQELLVFFSVIVMRYHDKFLVAAYEQLLQEREWLLYPIPDTESTKPFGRPKASEPSSDDKNNTPLIKVSQHSVQGSMWMHLLVMTIDGHPEVAQEAAAIVHHVHRSLLDSPLGATTQGVIDDIVRLNRNSNMSRQPSVGPTPRPPQASAHPSSQNLRKNESFISLSFKRTASVATALKNLALGGPSPEPTSPPTAATDGDGQQQFGPFRSRVPPEWSRPPGEYDPSSSPATYQHAKEPKTRGYKPSDGKGEIPMPLKSGFFDWSVEYFREPQMKTNEPDEPGSDDYNARLWRRNRNEKTLSMTQPLKNVAGSSRWDVATGFFNNGSQPMKMCFHQFEDHLAISDDRDTICIWNWQKGTRLNRFSNGNPRGSKVNEARFINEDDQALLMTGSSDGMVKVLRNYESEKNIELVTSFRALADMVPSNKNAGLVFDWQQGQGKLIVAGDVKVIRVWNAATEICTNDIPARSGSCITSLTSDQVAGHVFVAGYGDGVIRVFDQREKPQQAMFKAWKEHKQWITNLHMQRGGLRELVSGSRNGEIKLWDLRMNDSIQTIRATQDTLRTLSVHEHAPVFATGTERHNVNVFNINSAFLNTIEPYSSFLHNSRSAPIAATAFHPHHLMLACSALNNSHVNIFTCQK